MQTILACSGTPNILGIFDFNYAPKLLLYSYTPIILVSLFLSLLILRKSGLNKRNFALFGMVLFFSLWSLNVMAQWLTVPASINMFEWMITPLLEIFIFIFAFYFVHLSINFKDLNKFFKSALFLILLPIIILTPTKFNTGVFDVVNCEANLSFLIQYLFVVEIIIILLLIGIFSYRYIKEGDKKNKPQILLYGISTSSFLIIFWLSNFFGELTKTYEINLWGPIGMVVFVALLTFLIVRFKAFDIKLIGAQALVWALVILVGSQFLFIQSDINKILNGITLVISAFVGMMIVRSVKKEVALRESLEIANRNQEALIHFVSHQLKGFFTKSKMIFSGLLEGDFGEVNTTVKEMAQMGLQSDNNAVTMIQDILSASNLKTGATDYNFKKVTINDTIKKICLNFKDDAEKKGLEFGIEIPEEPLIVGVDESQITQVFKNLIDNSIHYTPAGKVTVTLKKSADGRKAQFIVSDTGVGLSDKDKERLFTEGGKGEESLKVNVNSTGYGLYIVKKVVETHHGRVWAESAGRGHGSKFYVELNIVD